MRLPFSPRSAALARRELESWLAHHPDALTGPETGADDARMVVSELVGNAVRHAQPLPGGLVEVGWRRDSDGLDITVADGGSSELPAVQDPGVMALGGRGLMVVEALATKWWVDRTEGRTTIHAVLA